MAFSSGEELIRLCEAEGISISEAMLRAEVERGKQNREEVLDFARKTLEVMRKSYQEPLEKPVKSIGGIMNGEGHKLAQRLKNGENLCGPLVTKAIAYSMSVMEQNSAMGCVVAAPTAGSSGVMPGVFFAMQEERGLSDDELIKGFLCAGAVGYLYMRNASVAGAEAGCQAEIGAASAMTAAAVVEMCGGTPAQALSASAISISNLLGLVCDPIAGLVQYPCQMRNAMGASNALTCAEIVLSGTMGIVPFDEMLDTMYKIGKDMPSSLRETALGGCAATPTGCKWRNKIFGSKESKDGKESKE
ncbi:MAG: L-serine ammonia-lyase, iron-sulfur-dependent, subunit alpha [Eubacteriales bacterium]|nr:L-serine ammonia-lyase, iron-sulfur-dependent, subunit alpha [Eubacteriales bacterium]MDD3882746.1 L-serine ammonia-lyase, iron-sulfur-dependent, subunit alpha [Eubacteriales bacterium]MDD4512633.1 L-serine ammonia-lyase, iron-sulfur-dependent, subunit alpha [Eubacteriales bacterium]